MSTTTTSNNDDHRLTITKVRQLSRSQFVQTFKDLYEHHSIIAEQLFDAFHNTKLAPQPSSHVITTASELLDLFNETLDHWLMEDSPTHALALIRSHPKLGVAKLSSAQQQLQQKNTELSSLTKNSINEQTMTGLVNDVSQQEIDEFHQLNDAYSEKFGFPFIVCVRAQKRKDAILSAFRSRLQNDDVLEEQNTALQQIRMIAGIRLSDLVVDDDMTLSHHKL